MKKYLYQLALLILLVFYSLLSNAQGQYGTPVIRTYSPEEFKAAPENYTSVQNQAGIMYFGNYGVVLEYDGATWRKIPIAEDLPVLSLDIDNRGVIYVSAGSEFGIITPNAQGTMQYHSLASQLDTAANHQDNIGKCFIAPDGIYFQTSDMLLRYPHNIVTLDAKSSNVIIGKEKPKKFRTTSYFTNSYLVDSMVFIHDFAGGLKLLQNERLVPLRHGRKFVKRKTVAMLPYAKNVIVVCTEKDGLFYYVRRVGFGHLESESNEFANQIYSLQAINLPQDNAFVMSTINMGTVVIEKKVVRGKRKIIEQYNRKAGLPSEQITSLYNNHSYDNRLLWLTSKYGISRTKFNSPLRRMNAANDMKDIVLDVKRHDKKLYARTIGEIYFLKDTLGELQFQSIHNITSNNDWIVYPVEILKDKPKKRTRGRKKKPRTKTETRILAASRYGLFQIDHDTGKQLEFSYRAEKQRIRGRKYKIKYSINKLQRSQKFPHRIYAGTDKGVVVISYQNGFWIDEGVIEGTGGKISGLAEDVAGNIWISYTNNGVKKIQPLGDSLQVKIRSPYGGRKDSMSFNVFPAEVKLDDYGVEGGLPKTVENGIFYHENRLLFSTKKGLYEFDTPTSKFVKSNAFDIKANTKVLGIITDTVGNSWLRVQNSYQISIEHFIKNEDGKYKHNRQTFRLLPEMTVQSLYPDNDSIVWISGTDGLYSYNIRASRGKSENFTVLIRKVLADGDSLLFGGSVYNSKSVVNTQITEYIPELPFEMHDLKFEFASPFFESEDEIVYSYKLVGFDNKWSDWSLETKKEYTNLPKGTYSFCVKAKNIYGEICEETAYKFTILTPWYETWWFYTLEIIFFMLLLMISIILNRTGHAKTLTPIITMITVTAIFKLLAGLVFAPIINYFAKDIVFFKLLLNIVVGAALFPTWSIFMRLIQHGSLKDKSADDKKAGDIANSDTGIKFSEE